MITIVGPEDTSERLDAEALREKILTLWPDSAEKDSYDIRIINSAKAHGQDATDIDLIVFIYLRQPIVLPASSVDGQQADNIYLYSVCFTVEVKQTPPERVQFTGNRVDVLYRNGKLHSATEQAFKQQVSLRNYLAHHNLRAPFVLSFVWLRGVPQSMIPIACRDNTWGADIEWLSVLQMIRNLHPKVLNEHKGQEVRGIGLKQKDIIHSAAKFFTQQLKPSSLDRKRMERASGKFLSGQQYWEKMGSQLLIYKGRGGTGKTITLLKLAHTLYEEKGARVLLLTYNRALVQDIRRLLALMGIDDFYSERSIHIQTIHSFLHSFLAEIDVLPRPCDDFLDRYEYYKDKALNQLEGLNRRDISVLLDGRNEIFAWDYILIDESQDWPTNERDLLFRIYDYHCFVIADGVDQLTRSHRAISWRDHIPTDQSKIVTLSKSLRLKSSLCTFVQTFASNIGVPSFRLEANFDVHGGNIVILEGPYAETSAFHKELMERNEKSGNCPVDMLFCVPPTLVKRKKGMPAYSSPAKKFRDWGYEVWDAVSDSERDGFPESLQALRVVQYDSCRGLEGWIVVNFAMDEFYDYKLRDFIPNDTEKLNFFFDKETAARDHAAKWLLIPLTRAIDTLVIQISSREHPVGKALRQTADQCSDIVEWRTVGEKAQQSTY